MKKSPAQFSKMTLLLFLLAWACSPMDTDSSFSAELFSDLVPGSESGDIPEVPWIEPPVPGINLPPAAHAGADQSGQDGDHSGSEYFILNGAESVDPDGSISSYEWFENATLLATGVSASVDFAVGVHNVTLVVRDNQGDMGEDTLTITVTSPIFNQAPLAQAGMDLTVEDTDSNGYEMVTLDGSASGDPDGLIVSYRWLEEGTTLYRGPEPVTSAFFLVGTYDLTLRVTDDRGATAEDTLRLVITSPAPPSPP